jgi:hypothetical protein
VQPLPENISITPKRNFQPIYRCTLLLSSALDNHWSLFCLYGFLDMAYKCDHTICGVYTCSFHLVWCFERLFIYIVTHWHCWIVSYYMDLSQFIHQLMDIWAVSSFRLLWIMLWIFMYVSLRGYVFISLW